jgi:hypothetical protein
VYIPTRCRPSSERAAAGQFGIIGMCKHGEST